MSWLKRAIGKLQQVSVVFVNEPPVRVGVTTRESKLLHVAPFTTSPPEIPLCRADFECGEQGIEAAMTKEMHKCMLTRECP